MSTIVGIMDRAGFDANTDNLVLVKPAEERLLWVPRDTWCPRLNNRINAAYRRGGHDLLVSALGEHGLRADNSLVLSRDASEALLSRVSVIVPVPVRMVFDYPLRPTARIEDGRKIIEFNPPAERLRGERVHQWIGARGGSDLHRIERQKVLLQRLLDGRFDFSAAVANPGWFRASSPQALEDLAHVRATWRFETYGPLYPAELNGMQVLVRQ